MFFFPLLCFFSSFFSSWTRRSCRPRVWQKQQEAFREKKNLFRSAGLESNWAPLCCVFVAAFLLDGPKTSGASKSNRQQKKIIFSQLWISKKAEKVNFTCASFWSVSFLLQKNKYFPFFLHENRGNAMTHNALPEIHFQIQCERSLTQDTMAWRSSFMHPLCRFLFLPCQ